MEITRWVCVGGEHSGCVLPEIEKCDVHTIMLYATRDILESAINTNSHTSSILPHVRMTSLFLNLVTASSVLKMKVSVLRCSLFWKCDFPSATGDGAPMDISCIPGTYVLNRKSYSPSLDRTRVQLVSPFISQLTVSTVYRQSLLLPLRPSAWSHS